MNISCIIEYVKQNLLDISHHVVTFYASILIINLVGSGTGGC